MELKGLLEITSDVFFTSLGVGCGISLIKSGAFGVRKSRGRLYSSHPKQLRRTKKLEFVRLKFYFDVA